MCTCRFRANQLHALHGTRREELTASACATRHCSPGAPLLVRTHLTVVQLLVPYLGFVTFAPGLSLVPYLGFVAFAPGRLLVLFRSLSIILLDRSHAGDKLLHCVLLAVESLFTFF